MKLEVPHFQAWPKESEIDNTDEFMNHSAGDNCQ